MPRVNFEVSGGQNQSVDVNDGGTIRTLLQGQGMDPASLDILVDGQRADIDRVLQGGETVFAAPQVAETPAVSPVQTVQPAADHMAVVRVGKFPGKPQDLEVTPGATVREVLSAANLDPRGFDVRRNGQPVDMDAVVQDGDSIALYRPVQGNEPEHEIIVRLAAAPART